MQTSGIPPRVAVPFADSGTKNTIPVPSQVAITPGAASFTTGFPPLTMTPITAGGVPPYGADFNGILNAITNAIRWSSAGSGYPFDSAFAGTVTGYPKGALVPASDYSGYWLNTIEANATNPENSTSATTGWVPGVHYGATSITGLTNASITLTTLQAAKQRVILTGALTSSINLVFPAWTRSWTVVNNCTGAFSVTCKTPSGAGVVIPTGVTAVVNGDGTNIVQDANQQIPVATATAGGNAVNLSQLNAAITALGLGNSATLNVGTAAGTVAAGNDSRITGAAQKASNLSDLANASTARSNLGLGTVATANVGTGTNQIPDMNSFTRGTGYFKLPGGIIVQYFQGTTNTSAAAQISYPIPFPTGMLGISATPIDVNVANYIAAANFNASAFLLSAYTSGNVRAATTANIIAIGI